ncbi:unnamed protein product [Peronospora destructor]|uniref:Uncharacterized protein n=1 Tax=Peronospora destructor TaxID=86335 RepID=A0AAV0SXR0_9STRA|nr:unnamed protein product [Peronospora destructor]
MLANLEIGKTNTGAVSSAVLEALSYIEKTNLTSLVEHIYTKFFEIYKAECPLVFEAIRARHNENSGSVDQAVVDSTDNSKVRFVRAGSIADEEEELYWEKDTETVEAAPELKNGLSEEEVSSPRSVKLVDYDDDDDESTAPKDESHSAEAASATSPRGADIDEESELQLPKILDKARSLQFKNVFHKISWKLNAPGSSTDHGSNMSKKVEKNGGSDGSSFAKRDDNNNNSVGSEYVACDDGVNAESAALIGAKRKLALEEVTNSEPLPKKAKSCTPISSS